MLDASSPKLQKALSAQIAACESQIKLLQGLLGALKSCDGSVKLLSKAKSKEELKKVYPKVEMSIGIIEKQMKVHWKMADVIVTGEKATQAAWKLTQSEVKLAR